MNAPVLKDNEFKLFQKMIYDIAGINMSSAKKALINGRLAKRLKHYNLENFNDYYQLLNDSSNGELQMAVDLLTTNETYFFREPRHFDFLREKILPVWKDSTVTRRIWSAASSTGEEAYSLAMVLTAHSPTDNWEIFGTDISMRVLEKARVGQYPISRAEKISRSYLTSYCLKGTGSQEGTFLVSKPLRERVTFRHANLKLDLSGLGGFDLIFLRNVLIYFDVETKQHVVSNLVSSLKRGGYLVIGHSESLNGISNEVRPVSPSIYYKP